MCGFAWIAFLFRFKFYFILANNAMDLILDLALYAVLQHFPSLQITLIYI